MIRGAIHRFLGAFGYELHKRNLPHANCWTDIAFLLRDAAAPVVIDVGANVGVSCMEVRHVMPQARIHCIEPDPQTFTTLSKNVSLLGDVSTWQIAMGNSEGVVMLNQNTSPDTNSFLKPSDTVQQKDWRELMERTAQTPVQMTTLAAWTSLQKIERIHLLKTDCQGYDLNVLRGCEPLLAGGKVDLLLCEVLLTSLYEQQAWFDDILRYTRDFGYRLHGLYDINYDARGDIAWADALLVHPGIC